MSTARWQRLRLVLDGALDLSVAERDTFLAAECAGDADMLAEARRLLAADAAPGTYMDGPPPGALGRVLAQGELAEATGTRIGRYRLVRPLGSGGMGAVYLATRVDGEFEQDVAIKLIKRGMDSHEILRRFRLERQVLARLEHPAVARLIDGGSTDDGRPYLVMEHVSGAPIDRWCDERGLGLKARLELFLRVCAAVQFAHQNLVVHRDLKPSNILVGADGEPKLLDFGIAKLLASDDAEESLLLTAEGTRLFTARYASPEQARGEPIGTASDVYALGVILYELVSGERPYRFASDSPIDVVRTICEAEPALPSAAVRRRTGGAQGRGARARLARELEGDVDVIVLKAIRKDSARRYASVEQLASDLRRHLDGLPVEARPDTFGYRATKFARRNSIALGAAAAVFAALAIGLGISVQQYRAARSAEAEEKKSRALAEGRFEDVRELASALLFGVHDRIVKLPGSTEAREILARIALDYLDRLAAGAGDDLALLRDLSSGYARLGEIQGRPKGNSLGQFQAAKTSYTKARAFALRVAARADSDDRDPLQVAVCDERLGELAAASSQTDEALEHFRLALARREAFDAVHPEIGDAAPSLGLLHGELYDVLAALGRHDEAQQHLMHAVRIVEVREGDPSDELNALASRGVQWNKAGDAAMQNGDPAEALACHRRALEVFEGLVARRPNDTKLLRHRAISRGLCGDRLASVGDPEEARKILVTALGEWQTLSESDPRSATYREDQAVCLNDVGDIDFAARRNEQALEYFQRALALRREIAEREPASARNRRALAESSSRVAAALSRVAQYERSFELHQEACAAYAELSAEDPSNAQAERRVWTSQAAMAWSFGDMGEDAQLAVERRVEALQLAKATLLEARTHYQRMQDEGKLAARDLEKRDEFDQFEQECDGALAKLAGTER